MIRTPPPGSSRSSHERRLGHVGQISTAPGFEYEWNGVLLGPDLVWRDGGWIAVPPDQIGPDFTNTKKVSDADFDVLVRNVYKVLLTRGLRGVWLHSTDPETQAFLDRLIS